MVEGRGAPTHSRPTCALVYNNQVPRGLLDYTPSTVPVALVSQAAGGTDGITESAAQQRAALILQVQDANELKRVKCAAHKSEMLQSMFNAIKVAVVQPAPLLMRSLERECKQGVPLDHMFDGAVALRVLIAMSEVSAMKPGENDKHEAAILALQIKPLPPGSTPEQSHSRILRHIRR